MSISESIEKSVLELEEQDRLHLLLKLLESLEPKTESSNQIENWVNEADSRYQAWKSGKMNTISKKEVFRKLRNEPEDDH